MDYEILRRAVSRCSAVDALKLASQAIEDWSTALRERGDSVVFMANVINLIEQNLGYALLTNSANGSRDVEDLERLIFGRDLPR